MKDEEIRQIQSKHNAAIIAPAGHGKTEMITELVDRLPGKKLVLTHTNAGVKALSDRLHRKGIDRSRYSLSTISSFCMRWCDAYPAVSEINSKLKISDKGFYDDRTRGTVRIFSHGWARKVLSYTYCCVIVDEYQDCIIEQHKIFLSINKSVPVYVLGDPLQSIFGFAGTPVSWKNLGFEIVDIKTQPWRWEKGNKDLGVFLMNIRKVLMPALDGKRIKMPTVEYKDFIKILSTTEASGFGLVDALKGYNTALYITKWPKEQCIFSRNTDGIFQNDETQALQDLFDYTQLLDIDDGHARVNAIYDFICICSTHVTAELGSYERHFKNDDYDFSRIKKHPEFGKLMAKLYKHHGSNEMLRVLEWIRTNSKFRLYRRELFMEMERAIRYSRDHSTSITEAAQIIRTNPNNLGRYSNYKRISSRTLLSKGLEFDAVAIDCSQSYTATEMYVAMTRAIKAIFFITDKQYMMLEVPKGI